MESFGIEKVFNTIGSALNVFDFSFFISGSVTLAIAVVDLVAHFGDSWLTVYLSQSTLIIILTLLLAIYVCGLISWTVGRRVREGFFSRENDHNAGADFLRVYDEVVNSMNLVDDPKISGITNKSDAYSYMWIKLDSINNPCVKSHLVSCNRSWVMRAMFEGLMFSWILAILVLLDVIITESNFLHIDILHILLLFAVFTSLCIISGGTARSYARSQLKDIVIAYTIYVQEACSEEREEK